MAKPKPAHGVRWCPVDDTNQQLAEELRDEWSLANDAEGWRKLACILTANVHAGYAHLRPRMATYYKVEDDKLLWQVQDCMRELKKTNPYAGKQTALKQLFGNDEGKYGAAKKRYYKAEKQLKEKLTPEGYREFLNLLE